MSASNGANKRSLLSVLRYGVPGAREFVVLHFTLLTVFFFALLLSSYIFFKLLQIGHYAESVIARNGGLILAAWVLLWLVSFIWSARWSLKVSYRVAGPIKRIGAVLDEVLAGKTVPVTVRANDALAGVAKRINRLVDLKTKGLLFVPRETDVKPRAQNFFEKRASLLPDVFGAVPGAKEHALTLAASIGMFVLLLAYTSFVILRDIRIGSYAVLQISRSYEVLALVWLALSAVIAFAAVILSILISRRVAGPVRRLERMLDRVIEGTQNTVSVREGDALYPIAQKIDRYLSQARGKTQPGDEGPRPRYQ